jgi:hypothetical protein
MSCESFSIVYQSPNQSSWFEGFVILQQSWMWLKDSNKNTIRKGKVDSNILNSLREIDYAFNCGGYRIKTLSKLKHHSESKLERIEVIDDNCSTNTNKNTVNDEHNTVTSSKSSFISNSHNQIRETVDLFNKCYDNKRHIMKSHHKTSNHKRISDTNGKIEKLRSVIMKKRQQELSESVGTYRVLRCMMTFFSAVIFFADNR